MALRLRPLLFPPQPQPAADEQRPARSSPRCAACSAELKANATLCEACGAVVYTRPVHLPDDTDGGPGRPPAWRRSGWLLVALAVLGTAGVAIATWREPMPAVSPQVLRATLERSDALSHDPLCVANGLAYDATPVHVQASDAATLSWMDTLASAGLYGREPEAPEGAERGALRTYLPEPGLAAWAGARRLCIARGLRLSSVRSIGAVEPMRVRGQAYPGVAAEVVWSLDDAAPWLASPDVASAFVKELPAWRGGRWQAGPLGWHMTQRRHFYRYRDEWLTADLLERSAGLPPRTAP